MKKSNEDSLLSEKRSKKAACIPGVFFLCLLAVFFIHSSGHMAENQTTAPADPKGAVHDPVYDSAKFIDESLSEFEIITLSYENTEEKQAPEPMQAPPSLLISDPQVPLAPIPLPNTPVTVYSAPQAEILETSFRDYMISRGSHDVAITIDDGPSYNTPELLRVLSEEGALATFFVLGNRVQVYPEYARQIVDEGHEIANHSWSHFALNGKPDSYGIWQFQYAEQVIRETTGVTGRLLIRIPYGKVYSSLIRTMGRDGYRFVTWSIDTRDWESHDAERTLRSCRNACPGDIILIHSYTTSAETLRTMIRMLRDKGLSCITVSQMMEMPMPEKPTEYDETDLSLP